MALNDNSVGKHDDRLHESNQEQKQISVFDKVTDNEITNAIGSLVGGHENVFNKHVEEGKFPPEEKVVNVPAIMAMQAAEKAGLSQSALDTATDRFDEAVASGKGLNNLGEDLNKKNQEATAAENTTDNSNLHDYKLEEKPKGF